MADYYSILNKTISNLGNNTPEIRDAVYVKARAAIEKQLRNLDPVPSEDAVQGQLNLLEEAITLIESENVVVAPESIAPEVPTPEASAPEITQAPSVTPEVVSTPEPEPTLPPVEPTAAVSQAATEVIETVTAVEPTIPEPAVARPTLATPTLATPTVAPAQAEVAAPVVETPSPASTPTPPPSPQPVTPEVVSAPIQAPQSVIDSAEPEKKSGGFIKWIIWLLVILAVLFGLFSAWANRATLFGGVGDMLFGSSETGNTGNNAAKEPVRIGQDGEDAAVDPIAGTSSEEGTTELLISDKPAEPETNQPETTEIQPIENTPEQTSEETNQVEPDPKPVTVTPSGEVAYLYEEGTGGSGVTRSQAGVSWSVGSESPAEGFAPEPVILGEIIIVEKDLSVNLKIRRNVDDALSASHIIDLEFLPGSTYSGTTVESVDRFVMKATEQARGEPLVAVPAKVTDENFIIALNNLQQAVDVNTLLLRDGGWIDIPIIYKDGQRALIALEKGGTGTKVFTDALDDWKNR